MMMHTPEGFTPSHVAPSLVPGTSMVFAFAGAKLLIIGDERNPAIPLADDLERIGIDGARH